MTRRTGGLTLGLFSLLAALAPAPQRPNGPSRELKAIAESKVAVCRRMVDYYRETIKAPPKNSDRMEPAERYASSYEPIELWSRRLADARIDASTDLEERVAILQGEVDRIVKFSGEIQEMGKADPGWKVVADRTEYYRLDAEYRLVREKTGR